MKGGPWLAVIEALMVKKLLESQAFHAVIRKAHKRVHQLRHGVHPEDMGGTKIDSPAGQGFLTHFVDEIKGQAFSNKSPSSVQKMPTTTSRPMYATQDQKTAGTEQNRMRHPSSQPQPSAPEPAQGGFLSSFMDEIKDQFRGGNKK